MAKIPNVYDFMKRFPDDDACLDHLMKLRYGNPLDCPNCERHGQFSRVKKRGDLVEPLLLSRNARARHKDDHTSEKNRTPKHIFHDEEGYQYRVAQSKIAELS